MGWTRAASSSSLLIGWAALIPRGEIGWLEDLWIEPRWIGHGVGRLLFEHVATRARELGAKRLSWRPNTTREASMNEWVAATTATPT